MATEATDFFNSMEQSITFLDGPSSSGEDEAAADAAPAALSHSTSVNSQIGEDVQSMGSLRSLIASRESLMDLKIVPKMTQRHFIALWKTLYDMFPAQPEEQETYHCIATIGNYFL